jgi:tRNA threonylcarbamoyladenosine biosynthesis protein TsaB
MTLLAIDTATRSMGLALYDGHQILLERVWQSKNFHTVELAPGIAQAFRQCDLTVNDVKAIAIAIGPGSYTGLRIGLALAKGFAFAKGLPLLAVPTLDILANGQPTQNIPIMAIIRAGRARLAVASYEAKEGEWKQSGEAKLLTVEEIAKSLTSPTYICGELNKGERKLLRRKRKNAILATPPWNVRRPALLAELGWKLWKNGEGQPEMGISPNYLQTDQAIPE